MRTTTLIQKGWMCLPQHIIGRPSVVIGEGGSGKTETILKLAAMAAQVYNYDIIFVDAKGDDDLIPRFVAVMRQAGKRRIKLFPTSSYYGWTGDTRTLYNRLMAVQTYSEPYYEGIASLLLDVALKAPGGPPRNSTELLKLLTLEQLRLAYRGLPEQDEIERIKPDDANGVYNRYRAFFKALDGKLDAGFLFDETDAAYIKLDTVAFARECSSIGRYLVEDIAHYITRRKPRDKKVLIVIDEVSALAIENIANLSERLRSFGGAMLLTSQSEEGLAKTHDERTRILKTSHMLILHTCNEPERLIERAGMHKQVNAGWSVQDQEGTGHGTLRLTDEYIIPPDDARRLDVGECFVIVRGQGYKVHVAPMQVDTASLHDAEAFIRQEAEVHTVVDATMQDDQQEEIPIPGSDNAQQSKSEQRQRESSEPDVL